MRRTEARGSFGLAVVAIAGVACVARPEIVRATPNAWSFPLRVHSLGGDAKRSSSLDTQIAIANAQFAPFDVQFVVHEHVALDPARRSIDTEAELARLHELVDPRQIDVFVVRSLVLAHEHEGLVGLCPGAPGHRGSFVVIAEDEDPSVLAHELGHYFGLTHSTTHGNLMFAYTSDPPYALDAAQGRTITQLATEFEIADRPAPLATPL